MQVWAHPGERIGSFGILKVVDMTQLRVFADVDEVDIGRVAIGGKVDRCFPRQQRCL